MRVCFYNVEYYRLGRNPFFGRDQKQEIRLLTQNIGQYQDYPESIGVFLLQDWDENQLLMKENIKYLA